MVVHTRQKPLPQNRRNEMQTPPIVSAQEWDAAYQEMLVKEKALSRARDALAAQQDQPARKAALRH